MSTSPRPSALPASSPRRRPQGSASVQYRVGVSSTASHLFDVQVRISQPAKRQKFSLPVWIPGSYLVREFSQHLQGLTALQQRKPLAVKQLDKNTWQVDGADAGAALELRYQVYAFDASVRTAFLDATRGFFNPTATCVRVHGKDGEAVGIDIDRGQAPEDWAVATALRPKRCDGLGFGGYSAENYDELADSPVEMGTFWSGSFSVRGVPHRFVVSGAGAWFDGDRLLADTRRIVETQMAFWHGPKDKPPFDRYVFMLHASGDGYGGLEHRHSTALICQRADLPQRPLAEDAQGQQPVPLKATDGYTTLLGLISHEYFHTWNVKRLRPAEFAHYDYERENYTELLWFFEGFTSYYDDLMLRRAGLIDDITYLQLVAKTANQVMQTPGRHVQSVAQASFDAWVKYYRVGENTPNATVSYYTKGALVAMSLDLSLRGECGSSLDALMLELWSMTDGGPMSERDVRRALKKLGARSADGWLDAWVHGKGDLPVLTLLEGAGVKVRQAPAPVAQQLGLRVAESGGIVTIKTVLRGSPADQAGLAAGDEWLGVELAPVRRGAPAEAWRLSKLDDLTMYLADRKQMTALISRDKRLMRLTLNWTSDAKVVRLTVGDTDAVQQWLAPAGV